MLKLFISQIRANQSSWKQLLYFSRWKRSLREGASSVKDAQPWITFAAIDLLDSVVTKKSSVFEFGGGGSTLFFMKRAGRVVTVEHDKEWFGTLSQSLKESGATGWTGAFEQAEKGNIVENPDAANPDHYVSADDEWKGSNFRNYASVIDKYPESSFDVVLVDGRARPSCIKHAMPRLKSGGYLVVDNSDRLYYLTAARAELDRNYTLVLDSVGATPYLTWFTKTSIWRKK